MSCLEGIRYFTSGKFIIGYRSYFLEEKVLYFCEHKHYCWYVYPKAFACLLLFTYIFSDVPRP
jgi:hypothetical protein